MKDNVVAIQPDAAEPASPRVVPMDSPGNVPAHAQRNTKGEGSIFQRGDGYWYFQLVHNGRKYNKSLGTKNKNAAKKTAVAVKRAIIGRIERQEDEPRTTGNVTVGEIAELYIDYAERNLRSVRTIKLNFYVHMKPHPELWNMKASKLGTAELEEYRLRRKNEGAKPASINHELESLRSAYYRAKKNRTPPLVRDVPAFPIDHVDNKREGFLEDAGYAKILLEVPNVLKLLFVLAFHLGCRVGELLKLKWEQVYLNDQSPSDGYIDLMKTKNGKDRRAPIYHDMHNWLKWQRAIRDKYFPSCDHVLFHHESIGTAIAGNPLKEVRESWNSAVKRAGYPGLLMHDLRRTACRNMVQKAKIPRANAKVISGHLTDSMFERYNIVDPDDITSIGKDIEKWMSKAVESVEPPRVED